MRLFTVSDLHVDFKENREWIETLSESEYKNDILLLGGDVCHNLERLQKTLLQIRSKFFKLFFVPGNHDLWLRDETYKDSLDKFETIRHFCRENDISIRPERISNTWIVPIFSWYTQPGEGKDTLYWPKKGEDNNNRLWSDNFYIKWPNSKFPDSASRYFFDLNTTMLTEKINGSVISLSHFIPRKEMMFSQYPPNIDPELIKKYDRHPEFNFSRVAGSSLIDQQIRQIGSRLHVYGHQHINRDREIEGVRYVAHCLGYPNERKRGVIKGIEQGLKELIII
ncbi:MAG: metallophosphoesterase [Calditrichaceae bacterium]|nr:metallophosphoesterase [Calditrichaceae bacterium]